MNNGRIFKFLPNALLVPHLTEFHGQIIICQFVSFRCVDSSWVWFVCHQGPFYCWGYQWHYVFTGLQDSRSECHCCCIRLRASSWIEDCLLRTLLTRSTQRSSIPLFQLPVCCIPDSAKGMCLMNLGHTPIVLRSRSFWDHACRKTHVSDQRSYLAMRLAFHGAIVPPVWRMEKSFRFFLVT